jgi:hypothetical protein
MLCVAQPAPAAPSEPLLVTQLSDPDPDYVPPPAERPQPKKARRSKLQSADPPTIEQAMENLGHVTGQLAQMAPQLSKGDPNWEAAARERLRKMREQARAAGN